MSPRPVELLGELLIEDLVDEGGLAGTGDAGDADEEAEGDLDVLALEVVVARAADRELAALAAGTALGRDGDPAAAGEVGGGQGLFGFEDVGERAFGDDSAAVLAGAGPHVDDVVGGTHDGLVVLDDEDRVPEVAEPS